MGKIGHRLSMNATSTFHDLSGIWSMQFNQHPNITHIDTWVSWRCPHSIPHTYGRDGYTWQVWAIHEQWNKIYVLLCTKTQKKSDRVEHSCKCSQLLRYGRSCTSVEIYVK